MGAYVIQSAQGTSVTATGTVSLPGSTRAGNTLVALASVRNVTTNASLSSVTLGGLADNFGQAVSFGSTSTAGQLYWWLDPLCAGGQSSVVFTTTGGSGNEALAMTVLEVGGLLPLQATSALSVDVSSSGSASSATWNSGTTQVTSWQSELWVGGVVAAGTRTITGPGYPWSPAIPGTFSANVTLPAQTVGTSSITLFGYEVRPSQGSASFAGSFAASQAYVAGVVAIPALTVTPSLPDFVAGMGPQQGDMVSLVTAPLAFFQQRVVFRAAQLNTTTTLPGKATGNANPSNGTAIAFDTVYEDPYQGWNAAALTWTPPFTGWYQIMANVATGLAGQGSAGIQLHIISPSVSASGDVGGLPCNDGETITDGTFYGFFVGGQDTVQITATAVSGSSITTINNPPSTVEILWVAGAS